MEEAFGYVLFAVVVAAAIVAVVTLRGDRYQHIGRGGLFEDGEQRRDAAAAGHESPAVRDEEVRQMLDARNARRVARGEPPLDVDAELERLTRPAVDPGLLAEVRQLVEARNARRARQGKPPLDVESEVARQVRDLMG